MNRLPFRLVLVAVLVPFAFAVAGSAIQLAWLPSLPAEVITHWGLDGPDGWSPTWTVPLLLAVIAVVFPVGFSLLLWRTVRPAGPSWAQKLIAAASLFVVVMLSIISTGSLYIQLPSTRSDDIAPVVFLGVGVSAVLAVAAWFVMPRAVNARSATDAPPRPVVVAPGERVAWVGRARISTTMLTVLIALLIPITGLVVYVAVASGIWWVLIVPVIIGVSILGTASWRVRVDEAGLTVRGAMGWPQFIIPAADVASATVAHVEALGEFGGWGVRFAPDGRTGVITRAGEALDVKRRSGRTLVVTVDDAGTAAGLLTTLSARVAKG